MSTVKCNNAQIGQSVTATNNFTWYQPASPDGTVRLGNGNSGSVTDVLTVGTTGNLTLTGTAITLSNSAVISAASTKTLTLNGGGGTNGLVLDASNNVSIANNLTLSNGTANGIAYLNASKQVSSGAGLAFDGQYVSIGTGLSNPNGFKFLAAGGGLAASLTANHSTGEIQNFATTNYYQTWYANNSEKMRLDSSGNLGLGVTPSGWSSGNSAIEANYGNFSGRISCQIAANYYYNAGTKYIANGYSGAYSINRDTGTHEWNIASNNLSGAGATIAFTKAMVLDAGGIFQVASGVFQGSGPQSIICTTQGTWYNIPNTSRAWAGILILRDDTIGGTDLWVIDPNYGVVRIGGNGNTGAASLQWSGSSWQIKTTAGGNGRTYSYAIIAA